jgi:DNA-binding YbaB/EbfC family protein
MSRPPFDLTQVLQQAQEFGGKLQRLQAELRHRTVQTTAGGGMVEVTVNGAMEVVSVRIDPQAVDRRDVEMLQDLVVAAVNQGIRRAREMAQEAMQQAMGIPMGDVLQLLGQLK